MSEHETFDEYCIRHNIAYGDEGPAFAAYLHSISGWDGDFGEVGK